jgi:hypothetical protein
MEGEPTSSNRRFKARPRMAVDDAVVGHITRPYKPPTVVLRSPKNGYRVRA